MLLIIFKLSDLIFDNKINGTLLKCLRQIRYDMNARSTMFMALYCVVINIKLNNKRISILTRTFNPPRTTA